MKTQTRVTTPRYQQAMEAVREGIRLGKYAPGQKLPGMKEMSRTLGMNFLTVRRAMMELADKGIVTIRHGAGTFVQEPPRAQKKKRIKIGLAIRNFMLNIDRNHPTVGAFLAGAHQRCQGQEYRVQALVFNEGRFTEQLKSTILEEALDGIIVTAAGMTKADYQFLQQQNIPVVDCSGTGMARLSVALDKPAALRQSVEHLRMFGHSRIAFMYFTHVPQNDTLKQCFAQIVLDHRLGNPREMTVCIDNPANETHWEDVAALFDLTPLPTAVIVPDEFVADQVFDYAETQGVNVPEQLSLVALQDSRPQGHRIPITSFSTARQLSSIVNTACDLLIKSVRGEETGPNHIRIAPELAAKASSGPAINGKALARD